MSAFVVNRNNEISEYLPELKKNYGTPNNTTAIYLAIEDLILFKLPEFERLKEIEEKYKSLKSILKERNEQDAKIKNMILKELNNT